MEHIMQLNVDTIKNLLANNDKAVGRALIVLRNRQTADEKISETTKHQNGRGFRPCHARMGTNMADFFEKRGYLSPKQAAYWRAPMKDGNSRIEIYSRQLLEEAQAKAAAAVVAALRSQQVEDDAVIEQFDAHTTDFAALEAAIEEFEAHVRHKSDFAALEAAAEERAYKHAMQLEMALEAHDLWPADPLTTSLHSATL